MRILENKASKQFVPYPCSLWRVIRFDGTDAHGNRMYLCECLCTDPLPPTPRRVRGSDLKSGKSLGCGCVRSRELWEANRESSKAPLVVSSGEGVHPQNNEYTKDSESRQNSPLLGERYRAPVAPATPATAASNGSSHTVVINPADIGVWYCYHGKPGDNTRLGTSSQCYECRHIKDGADAAQAAEIARRQWGARLALDPELSVERGAAPRGGKNFVTGGIDLEFADQRSQQKLNGGKRVSSALPSYDGNERGSPGYEKEFGDIEARERAATDAFKPGQPAKKVKGAGAPMPKEFKGRHNNGKWKRSRESWPDLAWVARANAKSDDSSDAISLK